MRSMLLRTAALAVLLTISANARAEDARQVLEKAQQAIKSLKSVSYHSYYVGTWREESRKYERTADVTLVRSNVAVPKLRVNAVWLPADDTSKPTIEVASDSVTVELMDHRRDKFERRDGAQGLSLIAKVESVLEPEFFAADPFKDIASGAKLKYAGTGDVEGVACHIIEVSEGEGKNSETWYFGKDDYLPRRVIRTTPLPMGTSVRTLTLTNVKPNPTVNDELFQLEEPKADGAVSEAKADSDGGAAKAAKTKEAAGADEVEPSGPPTVGDIAPNWTLKAPDGSSITLKDLRGQVVLIDFWATWCGPCKAAMPGIQKIHEKFKDKPVRVFGISTWERGDAAAYMKDKKYTYGLLLQGDDVAKRYGVRGIPTFFVIGHDGRVIYTAAGSGRDDQIEEAVAKGVQAIGH